MTNSDVPAVAAGWYPDPAGTTSSRWWDGVQWTEHLQTPYSTQGAGMQWQAPAGTPVYNVWIWLVVFLPYATLPFLFFFNWGEILSTAQYSSANASSSMQMRLLTSPAYLASVVIGFVALGVNLISGYRDYKLLRDTGMQRPFHWAWNFFQLGGYPVYPIGRAIVTRRRSGKGLAVMWATIAMIVLSIIIVIVLTATIVATVVQQLPTIRNGF